MRTSEHMTRRRRTGAALLVVTTVLSMMALTPPASAAPVPPRYPLSILAGTGTSGTPTAGTATSSRLNEPMGVAVDSSGNVYIADRANHRVEKVTSGGTLSVFAGTSSGGAPTAGAATSSRLNNPSGVAVDSSGNVYIADTYNHRVEKVTPEGVLSIIAGTGTSGAPTAGTATSSRLNQPMGVAVDSSGNVYIADSANHRIEKVTPEGVLSIIAGSGSSGAPTAGTATSSALNTPTGVAVDSSGNVYIADSGNNQVEKVTSGGTLSVFAGTGSAGAPTAGAATSSALWNPSGVAVDSSGNVYIADRDSPRVEKVTSGGTLSVFAGTGVPGTPTAGAATSSKLDTPAGVAVDSSGNVYIANRYAHIVAKVSVGSTISIPGAPTSPVASTTSFSSRGGSASVSFTAPGSDGGSPVINYRVTATDVTNAGRGGQTATGTSSPVSIGGLTVGDSYTFTVAATNGDASYYGAESTATSSIVVVAPTQGDGKLLLTAGIPGTSGYATPGVALATSLNYPGGVAVGSDGTVYINTSYTGGGIYKLGSDGMLTRFAGDDSGSCPTGAGPALSAKLPNSGTAVTMAVDSHGNLYVPLPLFSCPMVVKITPAGALSIVAGTGVSGAPTEGTATSSKLSGPKGVAVDSADNVYITDSSNRVVKVTAAGQLSFFAGTGVSGTATAGAASSSKLNGPTGIAVDSADNVYIADSGNYRVEKVTPAGQLSFYAGTGVQGASTEGAATSSRLGNPIGLAIDPSGNLFIGDDYYLSYRVSKVTPAGQLSFYAGNGSGGLSTFGSSATSTPVEHPASLAAASNGDLYMVEFYKGVVAMVMAAAAPSAPAAPTSLVATPGNGSASIAFTAGSDGGAAITNYKYSTDNGVNWTTRSPSATTSPISITGLTNGTTYNVKFRAVNTAGDGAVSDAVSVTPRTVPAAPSVTVVAPGNGSASIAFTAGSDGGAAITNYKYSIDNGVNWITRPAPSTSSPLVITGLTNGTTYFVQLRAVNAAGDGTASTAVPVGPRTTPAAPSVTSVTAGNGSASVAFTPGSNGGVAVSKFQYRVGAGSWVDAGTSSPIAVTGLTNYTTYSIQVRAMNIAGGGAASTAVSVRPKASGPSIGVAYSSGKNGAFVGFTFVRPTGSTLVGFTVRAYTKGTSTLVSSCQILANGRSCYIGSLVSGTEYDIRAQGYFRLPGSSAVRETFESATSRVRVNN